MPMTWGDAIGTKSSIFGLMKIGVVREGKVPPDQRVPLTPAQCADLKQLYPEVELVVESSDVRRIADDEYRQEGVEVVTSLEGCDVLLGVKEVPVDELIPDSTYLFFSHTYKLQPYNAQLLRTIVDKRIRLIDYELIKRANGTRVIGFGRWAGIVGAYNGLRAWGLRHKTFTLPKAIDCADMKEMVGHAKGIELPEQMKIVLTGGGRVGMGAHELLTSLGIREVHRDAFLKEAFNEAVFTRIDVGDYNARRDGGAFDMQEFIADPTGYESTFMKYAQVADMFIAGHYWAEGALSSSPVTMRSATIGRSKSSPMSAATSTGLWRARCGPAQSPTRFTGTTRRPSPNVHSTRPTPSPSWPSTICPVNCHGMRATDSAKTSWRTSSHCSWATTATT